MNDITTELQTIPLDYRLYLTAAADPPACMHLYADDEGEDYGIGGQRRGCIVFYAPAPYRGGTRVV